jgi:peptidoglycan/LPS O-acetylase OafA/YrhL
MSHTILRRESLYLDVLRTLAALTVLFGHAIPLFDVPWVPDLGHQAVIVFFVLSGYVISNVADTRERTPRAFLVARFARLWSVLVPAMALTIACDLIGRTFGHRPEAYLTAPIDYPLIRLGAALSFLSESWVSIQPFSDFAAWSLSLEFWYYMIFAAWMFTPPGRIRVVTVGLALLLSGHKGILLLPVWLMGVALQRSRMLRAFGPAANIVLFLAGLLCLRWLLIPGALVAAQNASGSVLSAWLMHQLAEARAFWFDWIMGIVLTLHLVGARTVTKFLPLEWFARPIRWCAGISFAAYLFHMPLLALFAAFLPRDQGLLGIGLTLAVIAVLGPTVERSKHWWRRRLEQLADAWSSFQDLSLARYKAAKLGER